MLGAEGRTHREEQGDESPEFNELFPEGFTCIEGQLQCIHHVHTCMYIYMYMYGVCVCIKVLILHVYCYLLIHTFYIHVHIYI